jgi:hypothetical protein
MRRSCAAIILTAVAAGLSPRAEAQVVMGGMPGYAAPYWFGGAGAAPFWSRRWAPAAGSLQYQLPQPVVWYEVGNGYTAAPQTGLPTFRRQSSTTAPLDGGEGRTPQMGSVARYSRVPGREFFVRNVNPPMTPNAVARRTRSARLSPAGVQEPAPTEAAAAPKTAEPTEKTTTPAADAQNEPAAAAKPQAATPPSPPAPPK